MLLQRGDDEFNNPFIKGEVAQSTIVGVFNFGVNLRGLVDISVIDFTGVDLCGARGHSICSILIDDRSRGLIGTICFLSTSSDRCAAVNDPS